MAFFAEYITFPQQNHLNYFLGPRSFLFAPLFVNCLGQNALQTAPAARFAFN